MTRHKKQPSEKQSTQGDAAKSSSAVSNKEKAQVSHERRGCEYEKSPGVLQENARGAVNSDCCTVESECGGGDEQVPASQKSKKTSRKLDDNAFKPWGGCALSRSSSDTGSSGSETFFCKGGPGKESCGDPVLEGEMGVRCDGCLAWYHAGCQNITKEALHAIDQWHTILSWLCPECKVLLKRKDNPKSNKYELGALEAKVDLLDNFVRTHIRTVEQCLMEQEKISAEQNKTIERSLKENQQQKVTYAELVRGSCEEVVNKVSKHVSSLPSNTSPNSTNKAAQDLSVMFDDFQDKEKRKLNVVVHNLKEPETVTFDERAKDDAHSFEEMVKEAFRLRVACVRSFRVGKKMPGKNRLLVVTLENTGIRQELVRMAPQLRSCEQYDNIYINPDLTPREREQGRRLREELATRRQRGERNLSIRKGKIVCLGTTAGSGSQSTGSGSQSAGSGSKSAGSGTGSQSAGSGNQSVHVPDPKGVHRSHVAEGAGDELSNATSGQSQGGEE